MIRFKLVAKFILYIVICSLLTMSAVNVFAEKNKQSETDKNSQVPNAQKSKEIKPNIGKRSRVKTLEEFIPSEEVSADKPVAFPSDI